VEGTYYAGGMLALSKGTATLTNCVNNGNITSDNGTAGGLVGVSTGAVTFTNCQNYGNVTGITAAGICGNIASTSGIVKPFYSDLTNYGNITSTGGRAAGVLADLSISYGNITLSNLRNFGNVTGSGDVAGIISYLQVDSAYITNCVNNGDISGSDSTVSGIIGKIAGKTLYAEISDCKNAGTIKTNENQIVQYMGGIIAAAPDTFCVAISPTCNFNTAKDHDNRPLFNDRVTCTKLQISNCTNIGKILGSSSTYVGGIIGLFNYTTDKGITNCVNSGIIGGGANAGGITGSIYNYDTIAGFFSVNINKCINTN